MHQHRPPDPLTQLPARDPVAALAVTGGDAGLADELFAALLKGLPAEVEALRGGLAAGDWATLAELAHRVRGATRYCGVPALDEAVESLEREARAGDPAPIAAALALLEAEALRLEQASM